MRHRRTIRILAITLGAVCLLGFAVTYLYNYSMVLERSHFPSLAVTSYQRAGIQHVHVSGGIVDSAMAIYSVSTRRKGSSIIILPHAFLVMGSFRNGGIDYDVTVPYSVNDIRFGNKETIIWQRSQNSI